MRIRKNASKILLGSSAAAAASPLFSPPAEQLQKCELNQSPWDVMSFPLPPPSSPLQPEMDNDEEDELDKDKIVKIKDARTSQKKLLNRKRKRRRAAVEEEEEEEANNCGGARAGGSGNTTSSLVATCKKSDGKRWKCKQPASLPHSFCDYHITQLKSYNSTSISNAMDDGVHTPPRDHRSRKRKRASSTGSDSGFYYYYSGFGPWRGKKRGSGDNGTTSVGREAIKEEEEHVHKTADHQDEEDEVDSIDDELSEIEEANQKNNMNPRRRRRRKARSLKSLL